MEGLMTSPFERCREEWNTVQQYIGEKRSHQAALTWDRKGRTLYVIDLFTQSCLTLCNPVDCSPPGSLSMGFPRQEYWSGLPFPPPGDLPNTGIKPTFVSLHFRWILYHWAPWSTGVREDWLNRTGAQRRGRFLPVGRSKSPWRQGRGSWIAKDRFDFDREEWKEQHKQRQKGGAPWGLRGTGRSMWLDCRASRGPGGSRHWKGHVMWERTLKDQEEGFGESVSLWAGECHGSRWHSLQVLVDWMGPHEGKSLICFTDYMTQLKSEKKRIGTIWTVFLIWLVEFGNIAIDRSKLYFL